MPSADEDSLRAIRAADTALQERWPEGESPRSWRGVTWSGDRVQELNLMDSGLEVLPPQIGQLTALTHLNLSNCLQLKELPPQIGQLTALTKLYLGGCRQLKELPPEIGQLTALTKLELHDCNQLKKLPPQIGQLTALTNLVLYLCKQLEELPPQIGQLLALTNLNLVGCDQLTLVPGAEKGQPAQTIVAAYSRLLIVSEAYARLLIVEPRKDAAGELHAFLRANPLAVPPFFASILTDAAHAAWLGEAVKATPELAKLTDDIGRRAIDVAVPACKQAMQAALLLLGRFDVDDGKLLHRSATAAVAVADDHGDPKAKPGPRVALKAMRGAEQVCAELEGRIGLDPKYVVAIKAVYVDEEAVDYEEWETLRRAAAGLQGVELQRVPGLSRSIQAHLFKPDARLEQPPTLSSLPPQYGFVLVLDLADRSLATALMHDRIAANEWPLVRKMGADLARGLDSLHANRRIHADFKPLNICRVPVVEDNFTALFAWELIDFDVSCPFGEGFGSKLPSSGYCPPEMAKVLLKATNPSTGKLVNMEELSQYKADVAYDLWSFGAVLFHIGSGNSLWHTNQDDSISQADLCKLANWDATTRKTALGQFSEGDTKTKDEAALQDLVRKLLEPDREQRMKHFYSITESKMQMVLQHPFFTGKAVDKAILLDRFDVDDGKLLHRSATAAVAAAADHGDPEARPVPRVALKAMREVEQVRAELEGRARLDPQYVIAIKAVYADKEAVDPKAWGTLESAAAGLEGVKLQRVPGLSRSIRAHLFASKQVMDQAPALDASSEYKLLIVMELADRNLKHTIDHEHITGEDWPAIRHIASHLGRALDHVHAEGGMHADLKPLNAVGDGETWKIIDFDVFCKVGEPFGNKVPSSGYCPPEMAKVLLAATDQDTGEVDTSLLKEYVANEAYDLWSLGVVLYYLCFGKPLWKTDINDNVDLDGLKLLASVADEPLRKALKTALYDGLKRSASDELKAATDLVGKLLEPDPSKRLGYFNQFHTPMKAVLEEPFFQVQRLDAATLQTIKEKQEQMQREQERQTALLLTIKELSTENKTELRRTREVLMKAIFEATEVSKPTTFIVLNEQLPEPTSEEKEQLMQIAEDGSGVTMTHELGSVTLTKDGPRVEAVGKCKEYVDKFNTGMKWVHRLKTIGSKVAAGKVGDAFETIKEGLGDLVTGGTMYLYLVDELTCEPVRADGYPIVITTPSEIVPKLLPLMQVGLRAMSIYNGAGGIARLFGYPVPKVPEAWATGARESVELLKQESSVAQFGVVHEEVMGGSEESKSVRGHSLRVFANFLQENDPGLKKNMSGDFAGLQRIGDPNDGTALWTTLTDPQEIKSALEARTREREAEARDGDKYIQRAVEGLARQTTTVRGSENEKAEAAVGCCKWWRQTTGRTSRSRAN